MIDSTPEVGGFGRSSSARVLPPIDGGSYAPPGEFIVRAGRLETSAQGQDRRPHGGRRVWKAERVHRSGRAARRALQKGDRAR